MQTSFLRALALLVHIFASSSARNNHSSKPLTRLRNEPKSVKRERFILEQEFNSFIGLVGLYDEEKRIVNAPKSIILDESTMPSLQPKYYLDSKQLQALRLTTQTLVTLKEIVGLALLQ